MFLRHSQINQREQLAASVVGNTNMKQKLGSMYSNKTKNRGGALMKQKLGILEGILIKVTIAMLFGFGVGMISIRNWITAIEGYNFDRRICEGVVVSE